MNTKGRHRHWQFAMMRSTQSRVGRLTERKGRRKRLEVTPCHYSSNRGEVHLTNQTMIVCMQRCA